MLKYTDYDIVVELLPSDRFSAEFLWKDVNFRIVYISASYTENQFIIRAVAFAPNGVVQHVSGLV